MPQGVRQFVTLTNAKKRRILCYSLEFAKQTEAPDQSIYGPDPRVYTDGPKGRVYILYIYMGASSRGGWWGRPRLTQT
jgi:hypothetical protein